MTFFKINKQPGEDNVPEQLVSESDDKLPEETTSQKQTPLKSDSAVRREFSERTSLAHSRSNKGTITITVSTASVRDIARFQLNDSSLFQRTIEIVGGVLSQIDDPQVEITADCNCIWCQQKISEFKDALSS